MGNLNPRVQYNHFKFIHINTYSYLNIKFQLDIGFIHDNLG